MPSTNSFFSLNIQDAIDIVFSLLFTVVDLELRLLSKYACLFVIILLTAIPILTSINPSRAVGTSSSSDPVALWSVADEGTLIGPEAPLSVSWVGGSTSIVNNTLEFLVGERIAEIQGIFLTSSEDNHVLQFSVTTPGIYTMILSWNDPFTDLDVIVCEDQTLFPVNCILDPWWQMSTSICPEKAEGVYLDSGDYWVSIDWYTGDTPIEYQFIVQSSKYHYHNHTASGANITVNTEDVPDETYTVTASCYDLESNFFTDNITVTTRNQFQPVIEWFRYNSFTDNGTIIQRGEKLVIQWYARDENRGDKIFSKIYYKRPNDFIYSLIFSSWTEFTYTIDWNISHFEQVGLYRFKLEVNNLYQPTSEAVYFNFYISNSSNIETGTTLESSTTIDPLLSSTSGFSIIILLVALPVVLIISRKHK